MSLNQPAYLLVSHGSRDPRPELAVCELASLVAQRLGMLTHLTAKSGHAIGSPPAAPLVGTATLELASLPLHEQIVRFGKGATGCDRLRLLPLFLLPGVHVMEDIPAEVAIAQAELGRSMQLDVCPHLGSHPQIQDLLTLPPTPATRILLSHGSRRPGGNRSVEAIAAAIEAVVAYWSVPPDLESQVANLVHTGCRQIAVLPYFLFAGGITDAIAQTIARLDRQFPDVQFELAEPLGASPAMAELAIDLLRT